MQFVPVNVDASADLANMLAEVAVPGHAETVEHEQGHSEHEADDDVATAASQSPVDESLGLQNPVMSSVTGVAEGGQRSGDEAPHSSSAGSSSTSSSKSSSSSSTSSTSSESSSSSSDNDSGASERRPQVALRRGRVVAPSYRWGSVVMTFRPARGTQRAAWQATCAIHNEDSKTKCTRSHVTTPDTPQDVLVQLRLKYWALLATKCQSKQEHQRTFRRVQDWPQQLRHPPPPALAERVAAALERRRAQQLDGLVPASASESESSSSD